MIAIDLGEELFAEQINVAIRRVELAGPCIANNRWSVTAFSWAVCSAAAILSRGVSVFHGEFALASRKAVAVTTVCKQSAHMVSNGSVHEAVKRESESERWRKKNGWSERRVASFTVSSFVLVGGTQER